MYCMIKSRQTIANVMLVKILKSHRNTVEHYFVGQICFAIAAPYVVYMLKIWAPHGNCTNEVCGLFHYLFVLKFG